MTGSKQTGWKIEDILTAMYTLFKHTPARRDDFKKATQSSKFAKKYCQHRWLDNGPALTQALDVLDKFKIYVSGVENKKLMNPKTKSYDTVKQAVNDPLIKAKLNCVKSISQDMEPFLTRYQTDKPMLPFLAEDLTSILKTLFKRFIKQEHLPSPCTAFNMMNFDGNDTKLHKHWKKIDTGFSADHIVKDLLNKKKISEKQVMEFNMECKVMILKIVEKLQNKCPLKYSMVRNMDCLDPRKMAKKPDSAKSHFKSIFWLLVQAGKAKESDGDELLNLYGQYLDEIVKTHEFLFLSFTPYSMRVDTFHYLHMAGSDSFLKLWDITKMLLVLSHGQASVERGFSINKECSEDNQSTKGLIARRIVLDHIRFSGGVLNVNITKEVKISCRHARGKYHTDLKENPRDEETRKRKREEEKENIMKKKQKLQEQLSKLQNELKELD